MGTREGYDLWSTIYDGEDNALIALEKRYFHDHLGDVDGIKVVDVGCGTGRHSLDLAARGAKVTTIDFSEGMLEKARRKPGADSVHFVAHDLSQPLPLPDSAFDRVVCALVLDHVENVTALFRELGRVCASDGFILITVMHPAMMLRGIQARFTDPNTGLESRPASVANEISDYVMAAVRAKLAIEHISEHPVDESLAAESPRSRKYLGWPLLFIMRMTA